MIKITASKLKGHGTDNNARIHIQNKIELPCPYTLLKQYAILHGGYVNDEEPFFVFSNRTPLSARHVSVCLRTIIKEAGFDTSVYSSHSLRIGRTCDLWRLGLSVETIKKLGRWKSNAVYRYLRH